jgi:hypothetical protein
MKQNFQSTVQAAPLPMTVATVGQDKNERENSTGVAAYDQMLAPPRQSPLPLAVGTESPGETVSQKDRRAR